MRKPPRKPHRIRQRTKKRSGRNHPRRWIDTTFVNPPAHRRAA